MLTRRSGLLLACLLAVLPLTARADDAEQTFDSAVFLLHSATQPTRDGRHHVLLQALRHLGDPALTPLFDGLADSRNAALKVHGMLGLAECSPQRKLDLARLAAIQDPAVQAQIVTAAMDYELLSDDQARQIVGWKGVDEAVKVLAAAPLVKQKNFEHMDVLRKVGESDNLGRRALAHLLMLQLDDRASAEVLTQLNQSADPKRDEVREMLLRTVIRYKLDRAGAWSLAVAVEPGVSSKLGLLGLHAAMRVGMTGSAAVWRQEYEKASDLADRTRLALIAVRLSPQLPPDLFEPMIASDDAVIRQIGKTGQAIASRQRIADEVVKLIELNHPIANSWAMTYCREDADPRDAQAILLGIVLAYEHGPERGKARRLDDAVAAAELMFDKEPQAASALLKPILQDPKTKPEVQQGLLLGLIRAKNPLARQIVEGLPPFEDMRARNMALVLVAKHGAPLDQQQQADLALLVRGGGLQHDALRTQAAWTWLKLTGRHKEAIDKVLQTL